MEELQNTTVNPTQNINKQQIRNGTIYFIHEKKYQELNIPVYKIGYTKRKLEIRLSAYDKGYKILYTFHCNCKNAKQIEKTIINIFILKYTLHTGRERFNGNLEEMIEVIKKVENFDKNDEDIHIHHSIKISSFYNLSVKKIKEDFKLNENYKNLKNLISSFTKEQMHLFLSVINIKENTFEYVKQILFHSTIANRKKYKINIMSYLSNLLELNDKEYIPISDKFLKENTDSSSDSSEED
jgi:hypothetical protein